MSITERFRYGATELKAMYNRNLGVALGVSVGFHVVLIALYMFSLNIGKAKSMKRAPINTSVKLAPIAPPEEPNAPPPPPPPMIPPSMSSGGGGGGVAAYAGAPVAVPDVLVDPKLNFATVKDIQVADIKQGDGTGFSGPEDGVGLGGQVELPDNVELKTRDDRMPSIDDFFAGEQEAQWDPADLQRRIVYPDLARRNGIQGVVHVKALVDKTGKVQKVVVILSDNKLLEQAAVDAVKKTPFTPALQNKEPVPQWQQVSVHFQLE